MQRRVVKAASCVEIHEEFISGAMQECGSGRTEAPCGVSLPGAISL